MKKILHFDIETRGAYESYEEFKENDLYAANVFKEKFDRYLGNDYDSIEQAYLDRSPIISTYGKICCISIGYQLGDKDKVIKSTYGDDEEKIVRSFNKGLEQFFENGFYLSGYNIKHFDIPWVLHKLHRYGIKPCSLLDIYNLKPWENKIIDMYEDWRQKAYSTYSFEEVCLELGIETPKSDMCGKDVHSYFYTGRIEEIKKYCEQDISASIDVEKKIYL